MADKADSSLTGLGKFISFILVARENGPGIETAFIKANSPANLSSTQPTSGGPSQPANVLSVFSDFGELSRADFGELSRADFGELSRAVSLW